MFSLKRERNLKGNDNKMFFQEIVIRNELELPKEWKQEGPCLPLTLTTAQLMSLHYSSVISQLYPTNECICSFSSTGIWDMWVGCFGFYFSNLKRDSFIPSEPISALKKKKKSSSTLYALLLSLLKLFSYYSENSQANSLRLQCPSL